VKLPSATESYRIASQVNAHRVLLDELTGCNNRIIAPVKNVNSCIYKANLPFVVISLYPKSYEYMRTQQN